VKHGQLLKSVPEPISPTTGLRGSVLVKVSVETEGKVVNAEVIGSENQVIKNAALVAVKQWEWRLSYQGDKVVPQETTVRVNFGDYSK
jgi:TonB family protein